MNPPSTRPELLKTTGLAAVLAHSAVPLRAEEKGQSSSPKTRSGICLVYSNDRGRTWTKYAANPVLPVSVTGSWDDRDPAVFWHESSKQWVMLLTESGLARLSFYGSPDLTGPLEPVKNRLSLRILVDQISLEVFANEGRLSMTNYFTPPKNNQGIEVYAIQGSVRLVSCQIHELRSIWKAS